MNAQRIQLEDGTKLQAWRCSVCGNIYCHDQPDFANDCCKCKDCGATIDPKVTGSRSTICETCWGPHHAKIDADRLARATELTDYAGPVVAGDKYYSTLDDYVDQLDADGRDWPEFVHTCHVRQYALDIDDALQNVIENGDAGDHTPDHDDFDGLDELRKAVDTFNEANKSLVYWDQDSKHKVRVPKPDALTPTQQIENDIQDRMIQACKPDMCVRPMACDCPSCVEKYGPVHPDNVGKDLRSNPTGDVQETRNG